MRRLSLAALTLAFAFSTTAMAASPCRDASGKFIKCATVKPKKCRDAKGKFSACAPGVAQGAGKSG